MNTRESLDSAEAHHRQLAAYHNAVAKAYRALADEHEQKADAADEAVFDIQDERWRIIDNEKAVEVTARLMLPVLMADNPRDLDATDGEEPDRSEAYERRCNLQDRYNQ